CLRVPADHNHDPDLIFVEAARRMNKYTSRISELEARVKELKDANQDMFESYIDRVKELNDRIAELEAENKRLREEQLFQNAINQFIGYGFGKHQDLIDMVASMGLTKDEWDRWKK